MSSTRSPYRRIIRRETHSPRSGLAVFLAVVVIIVSAWVGTESVLNLLSSRALLVAPRDAAHALVGIPDLSAPLVILVGILAAIFGVIIVLVGLLPGRRPRHDLTTDRSAVVVDNEVVASALAGRAALAGGVDPDQVSVSVSHRTAVVHLTPVSGLPVDSAFVNETVADELESYGLRPTLRAKVLVAPRGEIGA